MYILQVPMLVHILTNLLVLRSIAALWYSCFSYRLLRVLRC